MHSGLPVAGSALAMGHRKYLDLAISQPVDQAEGKPGEKVAPSASAVSWPSVRGCGYGFNGMPQFFAKTARCNQAVLRVSLVGCCCFLGGRRVELNGCWGHASRGAVASSVHSKGWV